MPLLSPEDRTGRPGGELVAKAEIDTDAFDVVGLAIIHPRVTEPPCVRHLAGDANAILAERADAAGAEREARTRSHKSRVRVAGELMPDNARHERRQDEIARGECRTNPATEPTKGAVDRINENGSRRHSAGSGNRDGIDAEVRPDQRARRFDKARGADPELIARRTAERCRASTDTLIVQPDLGLGDVSAVEVFPQQSIGKKASARHRCVDADERYVEPAGGHAREFMATSCQESACQADMNVRPAAVDIEARNIRANLKSGVVRPEGGIALERPGHAHESDRPHSAVVDAATYPTHPYPSTRLIRLRVGRAADECVGLRPERSVGGIERRLKGGRRGRANGSGRTTAARWGWWGCLSYRRRVAQRQSDQCDDPNEKFLHLCPLSPP